MQTKHTAKKDIIMNTAKSLFSQKGYDATGMEEIALQAGVPKSLIYYHFKSKDELLNAIIRKFFSEYEQLIKATDRKQIGTERYFDFLYSNKEFLRIIIVESLKSNMGSVPIFDVVHKVLQHESEVSGDGNLLDYHRSHDRWVAEFFTSVVPFVMFTCYVDDWCDYFKTDMDTAKKDFVSAYRQTHGTYHASMKSGE